MHPSNVATSAYLKPPEQHFQFFPVELGVLHGCSQNGPPGGVHEVLAHFEQSHVAHALYHLVGDDAERLTGLLDQLCHHDGGRLL